MKFPGRRVLAVPAVAATALLAGAAVLWLCRGEGRPVHSAPVSVALPSASASRPASMPAASPEAAAGVEQALLDAANRRFAVPAPHGTAELLTAAEEAVRAVLPGETPLFAAAGVPGVGVTLLGDGVAEVYGLAALAGGKGKRLRYRVRIHFLPGKYLEAFWPEIAE